MSASNDEEMLQIVSELIHVNPIAPADEGYDKWFCFFCGEDDVGCAIEEVVHEDSCIWVRAKKLTTVA